MSDAQHFVIERSQWLRGPRDGRPNALWIAEEDGPGAGCALGHYLRSLGVPTEDMESVASFYSVEHPPEAGRMGGRAGPLCWVNDGPGLDDCDREMLLASLFADAGIEVEFKG